MCLLYVKKISCGSTTVALKGQIEMIELNIGGLHIP